MSIKPINRWTEQINSSQYKVYSRSNPHYYQDKTGSLHSIDQYHSQSRSNGNISSFQLYDRNINSVGIRKDNNVTKYLGIRPDETQESGSQQMEWSIKSAKVNGQSVSLDLSKYEINGNVVNLGNVAVQTTRQFTRQMLHYTGSITNFELKYDLHLTGLHISNSKYTSDTIIRNNISSSGTITADTDCYLPDNDNRFHILDNNNELKYLITPPVLLNSDFDKVTKKTTHTLKDNGDGTYEYTKYPSDTLLSGSSPFDTSINYIDSTTIYSTAASDGECSFENYDTWTNQAAAWTRAHDAPAYGDTGDFLLVNNGGSTAEFGLNKSDLAPFSGDDRYFIWRTFLYFDTSAITKKIDNSLTTLNLYGHTANLVNGMAGVKSTAGSTLSATDFSSIAGYDASGWNHGDTTNYLLQDFSGGPVTEPTINQNNSYLMTSTATNDIENNDAFQLCLMDFQYDWKDLSTYSTNTKRHSEIYVSDQSGTDKDPYLLINLKSYGQINLKQGKIKLSGGTFKF